MRFLSATNYQPLTTHYFMFEILQYDFAVRALVVGLGAAVTAGVLGNFVVASRQAVISDMLAHTALAGVGLGIFLGVSPTWPALLVAIFASGILWALSRRRRLAPEAVSMVLLTGGLALALLFAHMAKDAAVSLETFLFGSILTIRSDEVWLFYGVSIVILIGTFLVWNRLKTVSLDPVYAESRFRNASWVEFLFMIAIGALVAVSLKIIGGLLVGALLVIPVVTAQVFCRSFRSSVFWSILFNIIGVLGGILVSFAFDVPASSAIVLSLIAELFVVFVGKKIIEGHL